MKFLAIFIILTNLFGSYELIEKAKDAGLEAMDLKQSTAPKSQIELGKKLYFDPRIANSNAISCNVCHNLALGGSNALPKTPPFNANVPTIFNAESNKIFLKNHLQAHITGDLKQSNATIVPKISAFSQYIIDFKKAYGNNMDIDMDLIATSIDAFVATLKTQSRFDDFLRGNIKALNRAELDGLAIFIDKGCVKCHSGVNLGGGEIAFDEISAYKFANNFKKGEAVKVPILRNITQSAPYLKSGTATSLKDAIEMMTKKGETLTPKEIERIKAFFDTLNGRKPSIIYPQLPME
ncbi:cytochrome-c peroxidase [Helicobacter sp. 23-1044]